MHSQQGHFQQILTAKLSHERTAIKTINNRKAQYIVFSEDINSREWEQKTSVEVQSAIKLFSIGNNIEG